MKKLINVEATLFKEKYHKDNKFQLWMHEGQNLNGIAGWESMPVNGIVTIDENLVAGVVGNRVILQDGQGQLTFKIGEKQESITLDTKQIASIYNDKWTTFTISKKQLLSGWITEQGIHRSKILIPGTIPEYEGCFIVVNTACLKEIANHDNILKVVIPSTLAFNILRQTLQGQTEDGKNIYGTSEVVTSMNGYQIKSLFANPNEKLEKQVANKKIEVGADQGLADTMGNIETTAGPDGINGTADDVINPDRSAEEIEDGIQKGQGYVK